MHQSYIRPRSAAAAMPAIAGGEYSSDEILVERIAAGDKLAMQVLFARHRTPVYRWLYRFVGNETVAEDLLSDVFFDVWQQADRFEGRAAVTTWLLSIAPRPTIAKFSIWCTTRRSRSRIARSFLAFLPPLLRPACSMPARSWLSWSWKMPVENSTSSGHAPRLIGSIGPMAAHS